MRLGDEDQHEGEAKADRQAAGVAEKDLGRMLVEHGETQHGAEQRERQQPDGGGDCAQGVQGGDAKRHRHDLRHRHPVEPVEKVDGIDEPDGAEHDQRALRDQGKQVGKNLKPAGKAQDHDEARRASGR